MRGNSWGRWLGISGFGESHGKVTGVLLEDIKAGVKFPLEEIEKELEKRRPGNKKFGSQRKESDKIQVLSGVMDGKTTGMPICLAVFNEDQRSEDYEALGDIFRPGHADWSWYAKFKIHDWRGGGRASGRETIARVAAGAVVSEMIKPVEVAAYPVQIGKIKAKINDSQFQNQLRWSDPENYDAVLNELNEAAACGDSLGGIVEVAITNVPSGLGDPVFGKLEARLAEALLSIGGVKGIEFGAGYKLAGLKGSEANDEMDTRGFITNNCGGILGGVSTGEKIKLCLAIKPTPSISKRQRTIDHNGNERLIEITGRHDVTIIVRVLPVIEAMVKLVIADCVSYQKLLDGKERSLTDLREAIDRIDEDILMGLKRRNEIVKSISKLKKRENIEILDSQREAELLSNLKDKAELWELDWDLINRIWKEIMHNSKKQQGKI